MDSKTLSDYQIEQENKERLEHRDVLLAIGTIFKTKEGQQLFKYLFKNLEVGNLPPREMQGDDLYEYLGFLRAGNTIYKLACEADSEIAATLMAKLERERYDDLYEQHRISNGLNSDIE